MLLCIVTPRQTKNNINTISLCARRSPGRKPAHQPNPTESPGISRWASVVSSHLPSSDPPDLSQDPPSRLPARPCLRDQEQHVGAPLGRTVFFYGVGMIWIIPTYSHIPHPMHDRFLSFSPPSFLIFLFGGCFLQCKLHQRTEPMATLFKRCERQRPKSPAEMCWRSRSKLPLAQSYHPRHPTKMVRSNNSNPPPSSAHLARPRVDPPVPPRWRRLAAPGIWWRQPRPRGLNTPRRLPWDGEFAHREVKLYKIIATLNKIELIKVFSRCFCIVD